MPRYFFNARFEAELVPDLVGVTVEDPGSINRLLMECVRDTNLDLSSEWRFEVVEEGGAIHSIVPLADLMRGEK